MSSSPASPAAAPAADAAASDHPRKTSSRFCGVTWCSRDRRWTAHITKDRQQHNLGYFREEVEAAMAYDEAARRLFGQWARPNFPTQEEKEFAARWYDRDAACRFFGVKRGVFKRWVREGRITGGRLVPSNTGGGKRRVYTLEELERLRHEMFGEDKLYKTSQGKYHVPEGYLRREEACSRFGVSIRQWERWERQGLIRCGMREFANGPKLYRAREIESLVARHGFYSPPYPDRDRPGVYRVPLGGRDITRREALIDAESLYLVEGGKCHISRADDGIEFVGIKIRDQQLPLRRLIMGVVGTEKLNVGHVNGDPLDCRRENLCVKTTQQRVRGKSKSKLIRGKTPSSRFKGVHWESYTRKWRAAIKTPQKTHSLGRYRDEIEAAQAYDAAARRYFGKHAWLNFPQEGELGGAETPQPALDTAPPAPQRAAA